MLTDLKKILNWYFWYIQFEFWHTRYLTCDTVVWVWVLVYSKYKTRSASCQYKILHKCLDRVVDKMNILNVILASGINSSSFFMKVFINMGLNYSMIKLWYYACGYITITEFFFFWKVNAYFLSRIGLLYMMDLLMPTEIYTWVMPWIKS